MLDLSWNQVSELPEEWKVLHRLKDLNMAHNRLTEVPPVIYNMIGLTTLNFKDNQLEELPYHLVRLVNLSTLEISDNRLNEPPGEVIRLGIGHIMKYLQRKSNAFKPESQRLDLSQLSLEAVPAAVCVQLTFVTALNVSHNRLSNLKYQGSDEMTLVDEEAMASLAEIIGAPIQAQGLTVSTLRLLTSLDVSGNSLAVLPVDLLLLTLLQKLNLRNNQISTLYLEFCKMPQLSEILRDQNPWRSPHESIIDLPTPEMFEYMALVLEAHSTAILTLNGRSLQAVTSDITLATALTSLNLDRNKIDLLTPDIADMEFLESLHLRQNLLATLPWEIGGLFYLTFMDLGQNKFKELPGVIGTLTGLRTLVLDDNALPKLPNALGDLVQLEKLNLDCNEISVLPPSMPHLTRLTLLDLSQNNLRVLPHNLGAMVGLQELYCHNNELTFVPPTIETCTDLHTLTFGNNLLSELPYGLCYLTNLTHLSVRNNRIAVLSPGLSQNILLVTLDLEENPIEDPPELVLKQGFSAVMGYLQRMFDVTKTGHVDLRDLELQDMPADLLGVLGPAVKEGKGSRKSTAQASKGNKKKRAGPAPITQLSLTGNRLQYLPAFVGELSSLRHLKIDDDLVEPPLHIREEGIPMMQQYLRRFVTAKAQLHLDLRGMLLPDVKLHYYKLSSLTSCDLGNNQLTAVPEEVFKYTDLSWLDLRNNCLAELPLELECLKDLRQLDARGNQLEHVPAEIFAKSMLVTLSLANNSISGPSVSALSLQLLERS